jgi:broad specificity phosphatase PhoE
MHRILVLLGLLLIASPALATEAGWALMRNGGQVVLLNHAAAPGSGDPANFDIENCRTQRNLSEQGRQQARRIGALLAARAAPIEQVFSSRYCRCLETARLAFGDSAVEEMEALDIVGTDEDDIAALRETISELVADHNRSGNVVLVTHGENVEALTGLSPRAGEAVIIGPDGEGVTAIGRIVFN